MNSIDFKKIKSPLDWEFFAEAFFKAKGKRIILGPSSGGDGGTGKDLIIEETLPSEYGDIKRKILVSCKHFAISGDSVNVSDEKIDTAFSNIGSEYCTGFLGFYSTAVSSNLQNKIYNLKGNPVFKIEIADYYDAESIEDFLLFSNEGNLLLKRFFPDSYKNWKKLSIKDPEQNPNFTKLNKEDFKVKDKDYFKKYYEGQPADWSIIQKYTFKRDGFDNVIHKLETNKVCLITGAGGEGKTTLLMQVGDYYLHKGLIVLYSFSSIINLDLSELKFKSNNTYLIILDNANEVKNLTVFVKKVKLLKNVLALLASRKNEWDYSFYNRNDKEDLSRWIGKSINLQQLSNNEIVLLSDLLQKNKILNEEVKKSLPDFIKEGGSSNFLLAVMIYATQGKSFDLILKDVIDKIRGWKNSKQTIEAIGYIVCLEVLGKRGNKQIYCRETMLKKLLKTSNFERYQTIKKHIAEEAFFQGSLTNIICTRNPVIAQIYYNYLFESNPSVLDKYDFYYNIIRETSISNTNYDKDVLSLIPKHFLDKDEQLSIQLLKDAISYGFFWNTYYSFIDIEILKGNIGEYNSDEYSARWLFEKAYEKNSKDPSLYDKWAKFELKLNNDIGQINFEYSPRWIFSKGIKLAPYINLFVIWANEEFKVNNLGINVEDEYSARWICKTGLEIAQAADLYVTWANIEAKKGNIGEFIDGDFHEYSARWICKTGIERVPTADLYVTWANIEAEKGNIGEFFDGDFPKYSARWICKEGIEKVPYHGLYVIWANIETEKGNVGEFINEDFQKYSARWICKTGIERAPASDLYVTWANIEAKRGNIGEFINGNFQKYSARWICKTGIEMVPASDIFIKWANIEVEKGNISKFIDGNFQKYSAQWILNDGFNKTKNNLVLLKWIIVELNDDNLDAIDSSYSAEHLYSIYKNTFGRFRGIESVSGLKEFFNRTNDFNL